MNLLPSLEEKDIAENEVAVVVYFRNKNLKYIAIKLPRDKFEKYGLSIKNVANTTVKDSIVRSMEE